VIRALVVKELRESAPLVALAGLGLAWMLANLWGVALTPFDLQQATGNPFVFDNVEGTLGVVAGALALLLGMKQSAWEEMRGTYHFLLHRPLARSRIFITKMAVGVSLVLMSAATAILLHGLWAAAPGNHASPFFWSMTEPAWRVWTALPVAYLGAFLSGIRPGKWYGSRLLPLAAGCLASFLLAVLPWWWLSFLGSIGLSAMYVGCSLYVARTRDY